jgi:general secretion pathway protein K
MKKRRKNERGVALILVLGSIAIMTVMLTEFQDEATSELSAALADRDALKAEYLAKSGVN